MNGLWVTHSGGFAMRYKLRRKILSQNFIYSRALIKNLVRSSSIGPNDTVLEIGPGKGFITTELLKVAREVIAIEVDPKLVLHLEHFFKDFPNLNLHLANFLDFPLPKLSYKVFANIPFSIEGKIVRKLIDANNPPKDCYIIIREDLAERLSGNPKDNLFSIQHKPWFDFQIHHSFKRSDFIPMPSMDCVFWRITKKNLPLLPVEEKQAFQRFIELTFGQGTPIKQNLKKLLMPYQLKFLSQKVSFSLNNKPTYLTFSQWLELYEASKALRIN